MTSSELHRPPIVQWAAAVVAAQWLGLGKRLDEALAIEGLAGIDIRIAKRGKPSEYERELAARVLAAGKRVRIHSWTGVRDGADGPSKAVYKDGITQGEQLARDALALGAESAGANSERDVWRGPGKFANPKAVDFLDGLADGFGQVCAAESQAIGLIEVGLAVPAWHYRSADLDKDGDIDTVIPRAVRERYGRKAVMVYQVDDSPTIVEDAELRTALDRARKVWPSPIPMSMWLGVGRIDDQGRIWGDYDAAREVIADRHAGIDEAVWYVGFGAIDQVLFGHARHPSLLQIIPSIAQSSEV